MNVSHNPSASDVPHVRDPSPSNAMPTDAAMARAVMLGSAIGVPVVFAILLLIELISGMQLWVAAAGAALPAAIFGAFIGSAWCIGRASDAAHAVPRSTMSD